MKRECGPLRRRYALNGFLYIQLKRPRRELVERTVATGRTRGDAKSHGLIVCGLVIALCGIALKHHVRVALEADLVTLRRFSLDEVVKLVGK